MLHVKRRNSEAHKYLKRGGFTGSLTGSVHSNIPCDQIIEATINCPSKSADGLTGKTEDKNAPERWVRLNPYMSAIKEHMDLKIDKRKSDFHVELGTRRKMNLTGTADVASR